MAALLDVPQDEPLVPVALVVGDAHLARDVRDLLRVQHADPVLVEEREDALNRALVDRERLELVLRGLAPAQASEKRLKDT